MKILLVGAFPEHPPAIAPGQYLQKTCLHLAEAFEHCGHTVETFDYRAREKEFRRFPKGEYRLRKILHLLQRPFYPALMQGLVFCLPGIRGMNRMLTARVADGSFDMVVLMKTELVDYRLLPGLRQSAPTWYYLMDWIVIARDIRAEQYAARAVFASATRSNVVEFFRSAGADAIFLTQGMDPRQFHPDPDTAKEYDAVFVGTMRKDRLACIRFLERNGIRVETFGEGCLHGQIFGPDLAQVYRKARIVLNFNTTENSTGFSLRVFEAMACGSLLISEHCTDLEMLFKTGEDLVWFKSPDECLALVRHYLQHEAERETIASRGAAHVLREYTWEHVARRICEAVEEKKESAQCCSVPSRLGKLARGLVEDPGLTRSGSVGKRPK